MSDKLAAVRPVFTLPIQLKAEEAPEPLNWFPGDKASSVAQVFTEKHGLDEAQYKQMLSALTVEAKSRNLLREMFSLNVTIMPLEEEGSGGEPRTLPITVYENENIGQVVRDFAAAVPLGEAQQLQLTKGLIAQARQLDLLPVLLSLNITTRPGVHEVLKLYSGDVSQAAVQFNV